MQFRLLADEEKSMRKVIVFNKASLKETAKIMAIPNIKKDIAKSRKQIKKGEFIPLSDLK